MANYKIKNTSIMHNGTVYSEGSIIELTENEAKRLEDFIKPVPEKSKTENKPQNNTKTAQTSTKTKTDNKKSETEIKTETEAETQEGNTENDK